MSADKILAGIKDVIEGRVTFHAPMIAPWHYERATASQPTWHLKNALGYYVCSVTSEEMAKQMVCAINSHADLLGALTELLKHAGIADADPSDIDGEDHARESKARAAISKATGA